MKLGGFFHCCKPIEQAGHGSVLLLENVCATVDNRACLGVSFERHEMSEKVFEGKC